MPPQPTRSGNFKLAFLAGLVIFGLLEVALIFHYSPVKSPPAKFNRQRYSINEASSLWVVVNKSRRLPSGYQPADLVHPKVDLAASASRKITMLRSEAASQLQKLFAAASQNQTPLVLASGFRSYSDQAAVYQSEVEGFGRDYADIDSARPGHSEHQTGWAADVGDSSSACLLKACFGSSQAGKWLENNAYKYGYIVRYGKSGQSETGFRYEPWHLRYVGRELAGQLHDRNLTMEQFFGVRPALVYAGQPYLLKP